MENKLTMYEKVSNLTGYDPNQVAIIQNNVAKNTTAQELAYFLNVCKTMELNPFNKEVWCYKDHKKNLLIFAGRDGFLSKAQRNPAFNGIRSSEIREHDVWGIDIANNKITHVIEKTQKERGKIIGAYAIIFRKDGEPTIEYAEFQTYSKMTGAWKTHPAEMIKKVAESHGLKKAFGISGVQSEYDYNVKEGIATPINTEEPKEKDLEKIIKTIDKFSKQEDLIEYALENDLQKYPELQLKVKEKLKELETVDIEEVK